MSIKQKVVIAGKKIVPHDIRIFFRKLNWKRYYYQQLLLKKTPEKKVYCPIAKKEFGRFIALNNDLITPSNGARMRQRLVWHYLENELGILNKKLKVLHTAPELSFYEILKNQKNLEYVPGDKMVAGYSNQKGIRNIDLTGLDFSDGYFDCIISNHVLEHIPDDRKAISEIFRVLKEGGTAVITVPIDDKKQKTLEDPSIITPEDREKYYGQWDHLRMYGLDIKKRIEEAGFKVEMNRYREKFSDEEVERFGFCDDIIIVAKKPSAIDKK